jgi:hypothetical protein
MKFGNNSNVEYFNLIKSIESDKIFIRHDIDNHIDNILAMAAEEYNMGIRSTYYFLHTARYFDYSESFKNIIKNIVSLGHNIGFHNDILTIWLNTKISPAYIIEPPLDWLKDICDIKSTSAHGANGYDYNRYINYQVWLEYDNELNEGYPIRWPQISLKTHELEEVYFMNFTHYLSDTARKFIGYVVDIVGYKKMFEGTLLRSEKNIGLNIIKEFNKDKNPDKNIQLLFHNDYWI